MGLLQREVAALLGVHATTINNWENNLRVPSRRFVDKIGRFLGS
jgi:transcriptional regulator with XRE-family HTH domain